MVDHVVLRPFIRWAGSKRLLVRELLRHAPDSFDTYFEPFLGGGSLALALRPDRAVLSDQLGPLVTTWTEVQRDVDEVLHVLGQWTEDRETYLALRREMFATPVEQAAQFIYLNRGAYGGLWRLNQAGTFNVPWSAPKTSSKLDQSNLRGIADYLGSAAVEIVHGDFAAITARASAGDFVFFDPPYSRAAGRRPFYHYNEELFDWESQERLAVEVERLVDRKVHVVLTNSAHPDIAKLYPTLQYRDVERQSRLSVRPSDTVLTPAGRMVERIFWTR